LSGVDTNTSGYFSHLLSGTYSFNIVDSSGCAMYPYPGTVRMPQSIGDDSFKIQTEPVTCAGANDGKIIITPVNPQDGPFVYSLDSAFKESIDSATYQFDSIFSNLPAGMHPVYIRQFVFQCLYDTTVTVPSSDQICTGIVEVDKQPALNIYPNPANTFLNIEYGDVISDREDYMLEMTNELGQIIYSKKPETGNIEKIDVSTFPSGLYIVLLKRNNAIISSSKFTKE